MHLGGWIVERIGSHTRRGLRCLVVASLAVVGSITTISDARGLTIQRTNATTTSLAVHLNAPVVSIVATPSGRGFWRVARDGGVLTAGDARFYGSAAGWWHDAIVGMAATPDGHGYWLVDRQGAVFSFGNAPFRGSMSGRRLHQPIVGIAATPDGRGYWLVASDGGIFAFNAPFFGSTGAIRLFRPIVGMASAPRGNGYWLVASDGGIFAFHAPFMGSMGGRRLNRPVVGMSSSLDGKGYTLVGADGGLFSFGSVPFYGSAANACPGAPAVGVATSVGAVGYWIAFANAQTFAFSPSTRAPGCGAPAGAPANASSKLGMMAADVFKRVNDERAARGLAALKWDASLAGYASGWSANMAAHGFRHSSIGALLGPYDAVGENIAAGSGATTTGALHNALMHSDEHRVNILSRGFTHMGVGVVCANGALWITEEFGRLMSEGAIPATPMPPVNPVVRSDAGSLHC